MILVAVNEEGDQVGSVNAPDGNNWITEQVIKMRAGRRARGLALDARDCEQRGVKMMSEAELDEIVAKPKAMVWMVGGR